MSSLDIHLVDITVNLNLLDKGSAYLVNGRSHGWRFLWSLISIWAVWGTQTTLIGVEFSSKILLLCSLLLAAFLEEFIALLIASCVSLLWFLLVLILNIWLESGTLQLLHLVLINGLISSHLILFALAHQLVDMGCWQTIIFLMLLNNFLTLLINLGSELFRWLSWLCLPLHVHHFLFLHNIVLSISLQLVISPMHFVNLRLRKTDHSSLFIKRSNQASYILIGWVWQLSKLEARDGSKKYLDNINHDWVTTGLFLILFFLYS